MYRNSFFLGKGGEPLDEKEKIKKAVMSASKKVSRHKIFYLRGN
jgi:hypothetical protein